MIFLFLLFAYLLGSIPSGLLIGKLFGLGDVRSIGSGNIGATNVLRTGKKSAAALTLIADFAKAFVPVFTSQQCVDADICPVYMASLIGMFVVIGHIFPVWLRFKGGKGVASILGVYAGINYVLFVVFVLSWIVLYKAKRMSSLSSILATAVSLLVSFYFVDDFYGRLLLLAASVLVIFRHRGNIARIITGDELSVTEKK